MRSGLSTVAGVEQPSERRLSPDEPRRPAGWSAAPPARRDRTVSTPHDIDRAIARLELASMGVEIDTLTAAQPSHLTSWTHGT
jgi:hypothetical protein